MSSKEMIDLLLVSCPSKVIDYPCLSLPALTGFLKDNGINVSQKDLNIEIKDLLIQKENLEYLYKELIPFLIRVNINNQEIYKKLKQFYLLLKSVDSGGGFRTLVETKEKCQRREYSFLQQRNSMSIYESVFEISKFCDYFFSFIYLYFPILKQHNIPFFLIDYLEHVKKEIIEMQPKAVGLSLITTQNSFSLWLVESLKSMNQYDGYIILGGAQPTKFEERYLQDNKNVDFVVVGEGEYPLLQLVNELNKEDPRFDEIPRLIFRSNKGIIKNGNKKFLSEKYKAAFPDFTDLPLNKYLSPVFPILASSNCPWKKCKFCAHRTSFREDYHERCPKDVVDEMEYMYRKYGTRLFHFADETIRADEGVGISREIVKRRLPFYWMTFGRLDDEFNEENIKQWYKGGARVIEWGLESAADEILSRMDKGITVKKAQEIIHLAGSVGIKNKLLTWHNYPGESLEDLFKTINFVRKNVEEGFAGLMLTLEQKLVLQVGSELYNETFLEKSEDKLFRKVWLPASLYSINASYYNPNDGLGEKLSLILRDARKMKVYCYDNDIFVATNENVSFDLILYQLKEG